MSLNQNFKKAARPDDLSDALYNAIVGNDVAEAKTLLEQGANPNVRYDGEPLLISAVYNAPVTRRAWESWNSRWADYNRYADANIAIIKLLLQYGADLDGRNKYGAGITALVAAAARDNVEIGKLLLKAGASTDIEDEEYGTTSMIMAAARGSEKFVRLLIDAGVTLGKNSEGLTPLDYAKKSAAMSNDDPSRPESIDTVVLMLTGAEKVRAIQAALIEGSYQLKVGDLINVAEYGSTKNVKDLLQLGADVNEKGSFGQTPLISAASRGKVAMASLLIRNGAAVNASETESGGTALHYAARDGYTEVAQLLLDNGASPIQAEARGNTPLIIATTTGRADIVQMLLSKGVNPNTSNSNGDNALLFAAARGYKTIVQLLLDKGANVNATTKKGETALMLAASLGREAGYPNGMIEIVALLINSGADIDKKDLKGRTAFDRAESGAYFALANFIEEAAKDKKELPRKYLKLAP